ncbi:hypothetical protein AX14_009563 [Amanita brunnescens Koide BX004]|nr:hypothetical protein AX14_009563 [Amanita brunnescens Koide BX004]
MDSKPLKNVALSHSPHSEAVFEDYLFYAALQRKEYCGQKINSDNTDVIDEPPELPPLTQDEKERVEATRALRIATWISVFFLLTTDMAGSVLVPYAISQVGWVPGIILFIFLGILSSYSGILIWTLFLRLDSLRYPLKTYADVAERIFGRFAHRICNLLQTVQLLISVGGTTLVLGQGLSQITRGRLCFSVCAAIFPIIGMIVGQVRTLKNVSRFAICTIWINIAIMCMTMVVVSRSPPNYSAARKSLGVSPGPVITGSFTNLSFYSKVNGVMNMVAVYSGAMIFPEIIAEMKRPTDFWKCLALTETFIAIVYLFYGCFIYAFQGQFSLPISYQGMSVYVWQTVVSLVGGTVVMGFYGNIAVKVIYINIVEDTFKGPRLMSSKGRFVWMGRWPFQLF